jgi:hypothetical protein
MQTVQGTYVTNAFGLQFSNTCGLLKNKVRFQLKIIELRWHTYRSKRGSKKGSVQHSATDVAELKEGRRRKDKKDEKNNEDKARFCKPGSCFHLLDKRTCLI